MSFTDLISLSSTKLFEEDAEVIHKACQGFGTTDKVLINAICGRSKQQLASIDLIYREKFGKSLEEQIEGECSGDYKRFLVACVTQTDRHHADMVHKACKGMGTNESLLIETINSCEPEEIEAMKEKYEKAYGKSLVDVLNGELSGNFEKLLVAQVMNPREQGDAADEDLAKEQAERLYKAAKGFGTDEKPFIEILSSASRVQVQAIKESYEAAHNKSLAAMIKSEFSGKLEKALLAILWADTTSYKAHLIHKAMEGMGTDEGPIVRLLGGSNKFEVKRVAAQFLATYDTRLVDALRKEIGGHLLEAIEVWVQSDDPVGLSLGEEKSEEQLANDLARAIAERDADWIFLACKGIGTNEDAIVDIICARNKPQIRRIDMVYREKYGKSLTEQIEGECGGDFRKLLKYVSMPQHVFDVYMLCKAMDGLGTDETLLFDSLVQWSNARMEAVKTHFEQKTGKALVDRVNGELSGHLESLAQKLLKAERSEADADADLAASQAAELHEAGEGQWGTNEEKFIEILASQSIAQLQEVKRAYEEAHNSSLEAAIKSETTGALEKALLALLRDPIDHQCERLHKAFEGWGTNETEVCRILGGNNKDQIAKIAARYFEKYDTRLVDDLGKELGGHFLRACVDWVSSADYAGGLDSLLGDA